MPLSVAQYVERVYYRVSQGKPQASVGVFRPAIEAGLPDALRELAQQVADSPFHNLLEKAYTITLTSGSASLGSHTDILHTALPRAYIIYSGDATYPLQYLPNRHDLDLPHPDDFHYFSIEGNGNAIIVRDGEGAVPSNGTLSVTTGYIPAIGDVPTSLEPLLIDIGVRMHGGAAEAVA